MPASSSNSWAHVQRSFHSERRRLEFRHKQGEIHADQDDRRPPPGASLPGCAAANTRPDFRARSARLGYSSREDGQPPQGQVRLLGPGGDYRSAVAADGSFQFPRVPAGTYRLGGGPALATVPTEHLMVVVEDKEISGLRLVIPRVSTVGIPRVVTNVEGGGPRPRYQVTFARVGARPERLRSRCSWA